MFAVKKITPPVKCTSCEAPIEYGIRIKEFYVFCGPECLSKKFTVHQLINMYKR